MSDRPYLIYAVVFAACAAAACALGNPPLDRAIARERMQEIEQSRRIERQNQIDAAPPNHSQVERVIAALERIALALEGGGA